MQIQSDFIVKLVVDAWLGQVARVDKLLSELNDEQLEREIAPGKNSGLYLVGHLAAIHDAMLPLLNLGQKMHPELEEIFIKNPDQSSLQKPSSKLLRQYWKEANDTLGNHFLKMTTTDWLQKHTVVSEEDFAKEPHRNKLNVLLSRTNHLSNHFGQMLLLKK
jgi:hypothetical protein